MDAKVDSVINDVVIMGAGLAGLTAGQTLTAAGRAVEIVESSDQVGGLARTVLHEGFRFDLGGHRFVTNNPTLEDYIKNLLGEDCLTVPRSSKILLRQRYFDYPLRPLNAVFGFGAVSTARILADYVRERLRSRMFHRPVVSLEDWVIGHFGRTMFELYFRDYSEKVWGIDCKHIDQTWIEQRIQGLSLGAAIKKALLPRRGRDLPTLTKHFLYPRLGIGQIAENLAAQICPHNDIHTGTRVTRVNHSGARIDSVEVVQGGRRRVVAGEQFVSTIPLPVLVSALRPHPPAEVLVAASRLRSRDLVTVSIMVNRPRVTENTWIYVPEKMIPFGRIHEPTNWSRAMAPAGQSLLVTEYFCFRGDAIWNSDDAALAGQTIDNLVRLGFIDRHEVIGHLVQRITNAYPLFEVGYNENCRTIYAYLQRFSNLYTAGRGGMFRYYNMDHAMQAGMDAAHEILKAYQSKSAPTLAAIAFAKASA